MANLILFNVGMAILAVIFLYYGRDRRKKK